MSRMVSCTKLGETKAHEVLEGQCEAFLFGDGGQLPPDYVPEKR